MRKTAPPLQGGFGLPLGFAAGSVATMVAVATGATGRPAWALALLAVTVAAVAAFTSPAAALGTALLCWGLDDGFVLGRRGDLVATPSSAVVAVVLLLIALIVVGSATAVRSVWRGRVRLDRLPVWIPAQSRGNTVRR